TYAHSSPGDDPRPAGSLLAMFPLWPRLPTARRKRPELQTPSLKGLVCSPEMSEVRPSSTIRRNLRPSPENTGPFLSWGYGLGGGGGGGVGGPGFELRSARRSALAAA